MMMVVEIVVSQFSTSSDDKHLRLLGENVSVEMSPTFAPKNVKLRTLGSMMFQRRENSPSCHLSGSLSVYCNLILLTWTVHLFSGFESNPKSMLLLAKSSP